MGNMFKENIDSNGNDFLIIYPSELDFYQVDSPKDLESFLEVGTRVLSYPTSYPCLAKYNCSLSTFSGMEVAVFTYIYPENNKKLKVTNSVEVI